MAITHTTTMLTIHQVYEEFKKGNLIIDSRYQRRKIWLEKDKVKLIETILIGLIMPEIYFWDEKTDPTSGDTLTHIIDGQQRITAIIDYIDDNYKLNEKYLEDDNTPHSVFNKKFSQLEDEFRSKIWGHKLSIVQIVENNIDVIKNMFYRLNLTDYSLNEQEKRHSKEWGKFANLTAELSANKFWTDNGLFNKGDIRRMKDDEFCASLILLARKGIINQTDQKPLNDAYEDYKDEYPEFNDDRKRILKWIKIAEGLINNKNIAFFRKRSQLFTIFCLVRYIEANNIIINKEIRAKFNSFIKYYNDFKNDPYIVIDEDPIQESIRRYKLAASEGVNKLRNRKIRFDILKEYIFG